MAQRSATATYSQPTTSARGDAWWVVPWVTVVVYSGFIVYSIARGFDHTSFEWGPYVSPFFSIPFTILGLPFSAALYNGIMPLGFRATCYYYRKSYYRAFFWDPPACAVSERKRTYKGETAFPFILNNMHRFFFYGAVIVVLFLWIDALRAFNWDGRFGIGLGTIWLVANVVCLTLYTFSCHSFRHLIGGSVDCFSCAAAGPTRHGLWSRVSQLNKRHGIYAWVSLFSVWSTDIYIRLVATGTLPDLRFI